MKDRVNLKIIVFFVVLTLVVTGLVIVAWENAFRSPFYQWVESRYPGDKQKQWNIQQRGEHFFISTTVDIVVVTLLLRMIGRQQRRLRNTEERYRTVFEHASDGIGVMTAADFHIVDANNKFGELVGAARHQLVGRSMLDMVSADDDKKSAEWLAGLVDSAGSKEVELLMQTGGGAVFPVSASFNSLITGRGKLLIMIVRDLSERRRLEAEKDEMQRQLYQTSRLASIGELSAGVAHEINNPLNCIINFAQLLADGDGSLAEPDRRMAEGIIDEGQRISQIVRDLLTFARRDQHTSAPVDVREIITNSMSLFGRQLQVDGISVDIDIQENLPPVTGDASRLRQVIVNMISNAHSALKEKDSDSKLFRITARAVGPPEQQLVRMEFFDNGVGIAPENRDKVFDPFFTTRRESGGTGLGLSLAFGIVREHSGTITVDSEQGRYTRFMVDLPGAPLRESEHGDSITRRRRAEHSLDYVGNTQASGP
jgi:PAS domain S-box-containing protein